MQHASLILTSDKINEDGSDGLAEYQELFNSPFKIGLPTQQHDFQISLIYIVN